jgi:hypothetical protein
MEVKGKCSLCGKKVYGHQTRGKDQAGLYVHMDCVKAQEIKALAHARLAQGEEGCGRGAARSRALMERPPVLGGTYGSSSPPERETPQDSIILARARLARGEGGEEGGGKGAGAAGGGGAERERERLRQQPQSPPVPGISGSSAKDLALGANKDRARAMSEEDCRAQAQV